MNFIHDDYAAEDLVGHGFARDALVNLIRGASVEAKSSFTVGLFGEWGSGKTSMLRQIETSIAEDIDTICIWFNPWQFSKDEDVVRAFFQLLAESLDKTLAIPGERSTKQLKEVSKSIRTAANALSYKTSFSFQIPFLAKVNLQPDLKKEAPKAGSIDQVVERLEGEYGSIYYDMIRFLRTATDGLSTKIVVFIDDLDRCLPEQALTLLEGLKVLLDVPNFVFIVGVDRRVIDRAVEKKYEQFFGKDQDHDRTSRVNYLDKIFQFSFSIPRPDEERTLRNLIEPALSDLDSQQEYSRSVLDIIGANPRSIKRFLNVYNFARSLADIRFEKEAPKEARVLKSALLAFTLPDLHRQLEKHPDILVNFDRTIRSLGDEPEGDLKQLLASGVATIDLLMTNRATVILHQILSAGEENDSFPSEQIARAYIQLSGTSVSVAATEIVEHQSDGAASFTAMEFVKVPPGEFTLGTESDGLRQIRLTRGFSISPTLVTQELYRTIVGKNPSEFRGDDLPVESVSWYEATQFCNLYSLHLGLEPCYNFDGSTVGFDASKNGMRLPTEAEWEICCKSESETNVEIEDRAWFMQNSKTTTRPVATKSPNEFGIYDMLGNVWEWCHDWHDSHHEQESIDPLGPPKGFERVCKGGSWANFESLLKYQYRNKKHPDARENNIGFRLVRSVVD